MLMIVTFSPSKMHVSDGSKPGVIFHFSAAIKSDDQSRIASPIRTVIMNPAQVIQDAGISISGIFFCFEMRNAIADGFKLLPNPLCRFLGFIDMPRNLRFDAV